MSEYHVSGMYLRYLFNHMSQENISGMRIMSQDCVSCLTGTSHEYVSAIYEFVSGLCVGNVSLVVPEVSGLRNIFQECV